MEPMDQGERRRFYRHKVEIDCVPNIVEVASETPVASLVIKNLSASGMLLWSNECLQIKGLVVLECSVPHRQITIGLHAKLAREEHNLPRGGHDYGFEFLDLSPESFETLLTYRHDLEANLNFLGPESARELHLNVTSNYRCFDIFYNREYSDLAQGVITFRTTLDLSASERVRLNFPGGQRREYRCRLLERLPGEGIEAGYRLQLEAFSEEDQRLIDVLMAEMLERSLAE